MAGEMASVLKRYFVPWQLNGLFVQPPQKKNPAFCGVSRKKCCSCPYLKTDRERVPDLARKSVLS